MLTELFNYNLPEELIAQSPRDARNQSRLLVYNRSSDAVRDHLFTDIVDYLNPGDCLVLNNTRVVPARFFGQKQTGAKLEGLFLEESQPGTWTVMMKNARKIKKGDTLDLFDSNKRIAYQATAIKRNNDGTWIISIQTDEGLHTILERIGFAPLPPYIKRDNDQKVSRDKDLQRYQTVYARHHGAVAAPTAGLHFTETLLNQLESKGISIAYLTLHVGAGTFKPVSVENLEDHEMHWEQFMIDSKCADQINKTKQKGNKVIAVGTTSVRTLETVGRNGTIVASSGQTKLFIKPGFEFKIIDGMLTNFHLPKSTLLALISAFAGLDEIKQVYEHAIEQKYYFYSYGDAMLIL